MKVAVVGAGFAGLALTWHLLQEGAEVDLYDEKGVGAGASGVSSGLLHPYIGQQANRSWKADEAIAMTKELLDISQRFSKDPVADFSGIIRKLTPKQSEVFDRHILPKLSGGKFGGHSYQTFVHGEEWSREASRDYIFKQIADNRHLAAFFKENHLELLARYFCDGPMPTGLFDAVTALLSFTSFYSQLDCVPVYNTRRQPVLKVKPSVKSHEKVAI